jgi:hypothetical protein
MYGSLGDGGAVPNDLDECNGHRDATNPFYHYHATANMAYPYLMNCLRGCLMAGSCEADTSMPAMNYDAVKGQMLTASAANYACSTGAKLSQAAIIAIIVCSCIAFIIIVVAVIWYVRRRRCMNAGDKADGSYAPPGVANPPTAVVEMHPVEQLPSFAQVPASLSQDPAVQQA